MVSSAFYHLTRCSKSWAIAGRYTMLFHTTAEISTKETALYRVAICLTQHMASYSVSGYHWKCATPIYGHIPQSKKPGQFTLSLFCNVMRRKLECGISSWKRRLSSQSLAVERSETLRMQYHSSMQLSMKSVLTSCGKLVSVIQLLMSTLIAVTCKTVPGRRNRHMIISASFPDDSTSSFSNQMWP